MRTFFLSCVLFLVALASFGAEVRVSLVRDGDTLVVENVDGTEETVRLVGIDSPEWVTRQGTRWIVVARCWAAESSATLRAIAKGRSVRLERTGIDAYGRTLGYVFLSYSEAVGGLARADASYGDPAALRQLNTQSLNRWLVKYGHARAYQRFPHRYSQSYATAENEAKKNKRGMWGVCP